MIEYCYFKVESKEREGGRTTLVSPSTLNHLMDNVDLLLASLVLVIVSAIMLAAPGSSVTGINGREEAAEAEGVTADGVTASSVGAT